MDRAGRRFVVMVATLLVAGSWVPAWAQEPPGDATRTHAVPGLAWGAAVGGALGGLALGVLSAGLCDRADCGGAFGEGFLAGLAGGGVAGGLTGLVLGAARPSDGAAVGTWSATLQVGARSAWRRDAGGWAPALGLRTLRAVTDRVRVGVEAAYLGRSRETEAGATGTGVPLPTTSWRVGSVTLVAFRLLGGSPGPGGWVEARSGVYPVVETRTGSRGEGALDRSLLPLPGVGVGGGVLLPVGGPWSVDLGGRVELVAGLGPDDVEPVVRLSAGVSRTFGAGGASEASP